MFGRLLRVVIALILLTSFTLTLIGCTEDKVQQARKDDKLKVAATIFPLADMAGRLGGVEVEVITLLPPGADPHTFEVTPKQAKEFSGIDLYIMVGAGADDWVQDLVSIATATPEVVVVTDGVELRRKGDPHIWLDPLLVKDYIAPEIIKSLCLLQPEETDYFHGNLAAFQADLEGLHKSISADLAGFSNKKIISFHPCWGYFCDRYGIEELATIEESPGQEPSASKLAAIVRAAQENRIGAIFAEPQVNSKIADVIANEFGGRVVYPDPIGGKGIEGKGSYLELMDYNGSVFADAFAAGLGGRQDE